jgi:hypothetical protein
VNYSLNSGKYISFSTFLRPFGLHQVLLPSMFLTSSIRGLNALACPFPSAPIASDIHIELAMLGHLKGCNEIMILVVAAQTGGNFHPFWGRGVRSKLFDFGAWPMGSVEQTTPRSFRTCWSSANNPALNTGNF